MCVTDEPPVEYLTIDDVLLGVAHDLRERVRGGRIGQDAIARRTYLWLLANAVRSALRSKHDLVLENLALRQQLAVLTRQRARTRTKPADRLFWSWLSSYWSESPDASPAATPEPERGPGATDGSLPPGGDA